MAQIAIDPFGSLTVFFQKSQNLMTQITIFYLCMGQMLRVNLGKLWCPRCEIVDIALIFFLYFEC